MLKILSGNILALSLSLKNVSKKTKAKNQFLIFYQKSSHRMTKPLTTIVHYCLKILVYMCEKRSFTHCFSQTLSITSNLKIHVIFFGRRSALKSALPLTFQYRSLYHKGIYQDIQRLMEDVQSKADSYRNELNCQKEMNKQHCFWLFGVCSPSHPPNHYIYYNTAQELIKRYKLL